jgi:hypothetical protein
MRGDQTYSKLGCCERIKLFNLLSSKQAIAGVFIALKAIFLIAFLFAVLDALLITNLVVGFAVFTECTSSFIFAV